MQTPEEMERAMHDKYQKTLQNMTGGSKIESIICPHAFDKPCRICDLTRTYYQAKLGKEHFLRQKAHDLNRKMRYYSNAILPTNPSEVLLFEYGEVIFKQLFGFFNDPQSEYKGFTDPNRGRNFFVKKVVPQGNKRMTDYFVEMRVQTSQIPDGNVMRRMHNLTNVVELLQGGVKPYYQSQLPEGRTEMRILPSWLGPQFTVFYREIPMHYLTKEEFNAIQSGHLNPYKEAGIGLGDPTIRTGDAIIIESPTREESQPSGLTHQAPSPWTNWSPQDAPIRSTPERTEAVPKPVDPPCHGSYDAQSPLCTIRCPSLGDPKLIETCKAATSASQADGQDQKAIRETAARLYK